MEQARTEPIRQTSKKALGINQKDAKVSLSYLTVAFVSLLIGGILGLLQGLERSGLLELPTGVNGTWHFITRCFFHYFYDWLSVCCSFAFFRGPVV